MIVKRYSEDPNKYWPLIEKFRLQTFDEGNDSLTRKKYNPDNEDIETWMCFKDDKLISISAAEKSHYTNDPDIAVRVCRYHILKEHRFTHCGLIMAEYQIKWAKEAIEELIKFPAAKHDDVVDTFSLLGLMLDKVKGGRRPMPKNESLQPTNYSFDDLLNRSKQRARGRRVVNEAPIAGVHKALDLLPEEDYYNLTDE